MAIQDLYRKLDRTVEELKDYYGNEIDDDVSLKVRSGYGYDKFYLNFIEGSYDMSLQSLINFMLQEDGWYKKLLSKETYRKVTEFNKILPEGLYDFSDNEEEEKLIREIERTLICGVRNSLERNGFPTQDFINAGYDDKSIIPHISEYSIVNTTILDIDGFLNDLQDYMRNDELSEQDILKIIETVKTSGDHKEVAEVLCPKYKSAAKEILRLGINKCSKKSECTKLIYAIKQLLNDEELIKEANELKIKL